VTRSRRLPSVLGPQGARAGHSGSFTPQIALRWRWRQGGPLVAPEDHPVSVRQGPLLFTPFLSHLSCGSLWPTLDARERPWACLRLSGPSPFAPYLARRPAPCFRLPCHFPPGRWQGSLPTTTSIPILGCAWLAHFLGFVSAETFGAGDNLTQRRTRCAGSPWHRAVVAALQRCSQPTRPALQCNDCNAVQ